MKVFILQETRVVMLNFAAGERKALVEQGPAWHRVVSLSLLRLVLVLANGTERKNKS